MRLQHFGIVHFINMVAGKHQNVIGVVHFHKMHVLINGVRRSFIPRRTRFTLIRRKNMYAAVSAVEIPRLPVPDVLVQNQRLILR